MAPKSTISQEAIVTINLVKLSEKFSVLPRAGGLLDQDKLFIYLMTHTLIWMEQRAELDRQKSK